MGPSGEPIEKFNSQVKICLAVEPDIKEDDACLGFVNEAGEWECQDRCLDAEKDTSSDGKVLCGSTVHFTNFAILLGAGLGGDGCDAGDGWNRTLTWLSVAFLAAAGVVVLVSLVGIEIRYRRLHYKRNKEFSLIRN